jgi:photosystem II stability/assembly factor-like uncharacterized protein
MMKRIVSVSLVALAMVGAGLWYFQPNTLSTSTGEEWSKPEQGISGAIAYLNKLRANQVTGEIDPAWVINAQTQVQAMRQSALTQKVATLGLQWEELGPDNIGGRTRAIVYDRNNPSVILAGSVSGGIFRTVDGGGSWAPVNDQMEALSVVSMTQAANGDFYAGTGEGMFYVASGLKSQGIIGGGIFKSTDNGVTFNRLPATVPAPNNTSAEWAAVGKMGSDPVNANRIYAATNRGLRISNDAGATWVSGTSGFLQARELLVTPTGAVWAQIGSTIYYSPNGDANSYVAISKPGAGAGELPNNTYRSAIAVSPQDENYVYVVHVNSAGGLGAVYRSTDKGATWTVIGLGSAAFNPMSNGAQNQGDFNLIVSVNSTNKDEIFMGGVYLWRWSLTTGWQQIHNTFIAPGNPFYVHVDQHENRWHPNAANVVMVGNDGGLFRSTNGGTTWTELNRGYNTVQYYTISTSDEGYLMGGAQDNGTHFIDGFGNTSKTATRVFGGDGSYCAISQVNNRIFFASSQYGNVFRANDRVNFNSFLDANIDPNGNQGNPGFADFIASFRLWESINDTNSRDSLTYAPTRVINSLGFGNGSTVNFQGTLARPQKAAKFVPQTFEIRQGVLKVVSDVNGVLTGDGTGNFNAQTGQYQVTWNFPSIQEFQASCDVAYGAGDTLYLASNNGGYVFPHVLSAPLTVGETVTVQDVVTGTFFMGRNGFSAAEASRAGLWMTRDALRFDRSPKFFQVATFGSNREVHFIEITPDGDHAFVAASGVLFRVSGLSTARDSLTSSIAGGNTPVQTTTQIGSWPSRQITSVAVNPNNFNEVVVTLGNYGNTQYVYYSTNALSATPVFTLKQGNLPQMPVYSAVINQFDNNEVILGTDLGIFSTTNIKATSVTWTPEAGGMPNVPVFALKQQSRSRASYPGDTVFNGVVFAATHGRGFWKTGTLSMMNPVSTPETGMVKGGKTESLLIFPNPATDRFQVEVETIQPQELLVVMVDMAGREVYRHKYRTLGGTQRLSVLANLPTGTYSVQVSGKGYYRTGKVLFAK